MPNLTTKQLTDFIKSSGGEWRPYSGRGMCGEMCVGINTDDVLALVADMMTTCSDISQVEALALAIGSARIDTLGRGQVLYFPRHTITEEG